MDRFVHSFVWTSREAGYHVRELFSGEGRDPLEGYDDLLRSTAVDAFVVAGHLPRQPAGRLAARAAGAVRGVRAALGRPGRQAPVGRGDSTAPPAPSSPPATSSSAATAKIAWIGWRKDSRIGEDRRAGWSRALKDRGLSTTGITYPRGGHRVERQGGQRRAARGGPAVGVRVRLRHARHGRAAHPGRAQSPSRPRHRGGGVRRLPGGAGGVPGPHLGAAAAGGRSRSRSVNALEDLLATPSRSAAGLLLTPTLTVRGSC